VVLYGEWHPQMKESVALLILGRERKHGHCYSTLPIREEFRNALPTFPLREISEGSEGRVEITHIICENIVE